MRSFNMEWSFVLIDGLVDWPDLVLTDRLVNDPKFTHDTHFKNKNENDSEDKQ